VGQLAGVIGRGQGRRERRVSTGVIGPFAELADRMWKSLKHINRATGAFSQDMCFRKRIKWNALTTTAWCLYADSSGLVNKVQSDAGLFHAMQELQGAGTVHYEMLSGARCIAGEPGLLEDLNLNLRECLTTTGFLFTFRDHLNQEVIPKIADAKKALQEALKKKEGGDLSININVKAAILRTLLWVTIDLGRCYSLFGVGDLDHLTELWRNEIISQEVYQRMVKALSYAQTARFVSIFLWRARRTPCRSQRN
jgi:hypothetical protein